MTLSRYISRAVIFVLLLAGVHHAKAQYYFFDDDYYDGNILWDAGFSVNAMNCLTDLAGKKGIGKKFLKDLNTGETHLSGGLFFSAMYKNAVALRLEGTFGKVSNRDELLVGIEDIAKQRYNRNLNFRSQIYEVSLTTELHPMFLFINWASIDRTAPRWSPYVTGGVGYFSFNPQGTVPGTKNWVNLQPLHTEGQGFPTHPERKEYKLKQFMYPMGGGIKYEASRLVNFRMEAVYRKLNTDYLDDLSTRYIDPAEFAQYLSPEKAALAVRMADKQINPVAIPSTGRKRGTATNNDGYFTVALKISLILGRNKAVY